MFNNTIDIENVAILRISITICLVHLLDVRTCKFIRIDCTSGTIIIDNCENTHLFLLLDLIGSFVVISQI
jgi:hypothetical protein